MFLRSVKAANGRHEYLRLVENYRQGEKTRQRVVLHIGRKDLLAPHLDALVRLLQGDQQNPKWVSGEEVSAPQAWTWGPLLVARHLFDSLCLGAILDGATLGDVYKDVIILIISGVILIPLGFLCFALGERWAKKTGKLKIEG